MGLSTTGWLAMTGTLAMGINATVDAYVDASPNLKTVVVISIVMVAFVGLVDVVVNRERG